jgi:hypothetical protein
MSKHKEMMERGEMAKHMAEHDMMSEHTKDAEMAGHKDKEMGSMEMQPDDGNMMSQQMGEHGDKMMSYHD